MTRDEAEARLVNIAQGCHDYGGGYHDLAQSKVFHHGIQTVINALNSAMKHNSQDTQINTLERIGRAAIDAAREQKSESKAALPVDRTARVLACGSPETPDHREIDPATGQQKAYVVLSAEERAKGFVRPMRRTYTHTNCGTDTTMGLAIAETYARDPGFYSGTFCCHCRKHRPLTEFVWKYTDEQVGS